MNLKFRLLSGVFVVCGLVGCGGGSSSDAPPTAETNNAPVANADSATTTNNAVILIDVLANDNDADADTLTITEIVTPPSLGSVSIFNNQIEYTPQTNAAGTDVISYRVSDGELTADADINLSLSQSFTLSGSVSGTSVDNAVVTLSIGDDVNTVEIDANGEYSVEVTITDSTQFVQLNVDNTEEIPLLKSLLGDAELLIAKSGDDRTLTPDQEPLLNLNLISTALFLLAEDLNANEAITDQQKLNEIVEQINAQDVLDVAAFMQLVNTDTNFSLDENTTALTFLDNDEFATTQEVIQQYLSDNDLLDLINDPFPSYADAFQQAFEGVVNSLPTTNAFESIINASLNHPIIALPAQQPGFVSSQADSYMLNSDGTGHYFISIDGGDFLSEPVPLTWSIENGQLLLEFDGTRDMFVPFLEDNQTPDIPAIDEIFGAEVAELYRQNPGLEFQSVMRINNERQVFSFVNSLNDSQTQVALQTLIAGELEFPDWLQFDGPNPTFDYVLSTASNNLSMATDSVLEGFSRSDIEGDWVLPIVSEIDFFLFENPQSVLIQERFTLSNNGIAIGKLTGKEFNWSFENGVISLETVQERYIYSPLRLNGKEYQILFTHVVDEQLERQQISTIAQFDDSYNRFTENIVTDLPLVYSTMLDNTSTDSWIGNTLRASRIFGFNFNADGTALGPIFTINDVFGVRRHQNWTVSEERVSINSEDPSQANERIWEVISVDEEGRVLVWERRTFAFDANDNSDLSDDFPGFISSPRINVLIEVDLSQYPEILERSDIR